MASKARRASSRKRKTIGEDPLDAVVPTGNGKASTAEDAPAKPNKVRFTCHLPRDLIEEARNAVVALSGPPEHLSLAALVGRALQVELAKLKRKHNGGEPFPVRAAPLRQGRPIAT